MLICSTHEHHFLCAAGIITPRACDGSGSAHVPCAGEGLWRSRTFLQNQARWCNHSAENDRFGATPKPARETRALPQLEMT